MTTDFVDYLEEIYEKCYQKYLEVPAIASVLRELKRHVEEVEKELDRLEHKAKKKGEDFERTRSAVKYQTRCQKLQSRVMSQLKLPVLGFNCGKYNFNAIKRWLMVRFADKDPHLTMSIKKGNDFMLLSPNRLKFMDVSKCL